MSKGVTVNISIMHCMTVKNWLIPRHYQRKNANFPEGGANDTRWMFSNKSSTAYKLPSGHMPDSQTILNLTVFSHLSQINTISFDLAYTWFI